jgi:uncharacterized membrane protein (UPF0136 family)
MAITISLVAALIVGVLAILVARLLHLSEFASVTMAFVPGMLVAFPAIKSFMGTPLRFWQWTITVALCVFSTWLIYLVIGP